MTKFIQHTVLVLTASLMSGLCFSHSTLKSTEPASGSILPESPEAIVINFNEPARLTSVVVELAGKPERKLNITTAGTSVFTLADPDLQEGRNEVKWKALSKDGHPIDGTIIIVIKPGATPSAPEEPSHHHHEH